MAAAAAGSSGQARSHAGIPDVTLTATATRKADGAITVSGSCIHTCEVCVKGVPDGYGKGAYDVELQEQVRRVVAPQCGHQLLVAAMLHSTVVHSSLLQPAQAPSQDTA